MIFIFLLLLFSKHLIGTTFLISLFLGFQLVWLVILNIFLNKVDEQKTINKSLEYFSIPQSHYFVKSILQSSLSSKILNIFRLRNLFRLFVLCTLGFCFRYIFIYYFDLDFSKFQDYIEVFLPSVLGTSIADVIITFFMDPLNVSGTQNTNVNTNPTNQNPNILNSGGAFNNHENLEQNCNIMPNQFMDNATNQVYTKKAWGYAGNRAAGKNTGFILIDSSTNPNYFYNPFNPKQPLLGNIAEGMNHQISTFNKVVSNASLSPSHRNYILSFLKEFHPDIYNNLPVRQGKLPVIDENVQFARIPRQTVRDIIEKMKNHTN